MPNPKQYSAELMAVIVEMRSRGESYGIIQNALKVLFPKENVSYQMVVKICKGVYGSADVKSTKGHDIRSISVNVCAEVRDFLDSLPKGVSRHNVVNSILLMYIRQLDLRNERLGEERKQNLQRIEEQTIKSQEDTDDRFDNPTEANEYYK